MRKWCIIQEWELQGAALDPGLVSIVDLCCVMRKFEPRLIRFQFALDVPVPLPSSSGMSRAGGRALPGPLTLAPRRVVFSPLPIRT